jgi:hypothetical protein
MGAAILHCYRGAILPPVEDDRLPQQHPLHRVAADVMAPASDIPAIADKIGHGVPINM